MLRLGIDLQSAVDDLRGMGRVVRSLLAQFVQNYPQHEYFLFAKNETQITAINNLISPWVSPTTIRHILALPELRSTMLDVCWYPWSRLDVNPKSGQTFVTIHDMARFAFPYKELLRWWDQRKDEKQYHQAARRADRVLTISHFSASEIEKFLHVPATQISVIYNGIDTSLFAAKSDAILPSPFQKPYLLFVGADSGAKNLPTLLQAFALLKRTYTAPLSLICWGSGEACRQRHKDILHSGGIGDSVLFPELQSDDTLLRQIYQQAELFVFPSIYEGFGLPPLEAMAAGVPVACSRFASMPEVVGDTALYFDAQSPANMAETILYLLENETVRQEYIRRGNEHVRQYSWANAARQHMKIFEGSGVDS